MGWSSGSSILGEAWEGVREHIPVSKRRRVFAKIADVFYSHDCDTLYELEDDFDWPELRPALFDIGYYTFEDMDGEDSEEGDGDIVLQPF